MLQMSAGVSVRKSVIVDNPLTVNIRKSVIVDNPPTVDISVNHTTVSAGRNGNVFDVVAADSTVSDDSGKYKQFHSSESGRMELTEPGTILSQADSNAINHRRSKRKSTKPRKILSQADSNAINHRRSKRKSTKPRKILSQADSASLKQGLEKPEDERETDEELATRFDLQPGATGVLRSRMKSTEPKTRLSPADSALLDRELQKQDDRKTDEELATRFGLKPGAIRSRKSRMGLTEQPRTKLSQEDSALLTQLLWLESEKPAKDRKSDEELAAQFGLKLHSIGARKSRMKLTKPRTRLSPANSALLTKKLKQELEKPEDERKTDEELAKPFGLKPGAIRSRKSRMGLTELKKELSQADSALSN